MPSRQDQLHSYQFTIQRVVAALVMRETDPAQSPFRRAAGATMASVLIAVIALGAVGIYGVFVGGGSQSWKDSQAVIVEKESGARYVYVENRLHPVVNFASALLIAGSTNTVRVSRKSIEGVARGVPLGIVDAPDSLPPTDRLERGPWTLCSANLLDGGQQALRSALFVGQTPTGGDALGEQGLLVQGPDGEMYLIWHNHRHLIRDRDILSAPGWGRAYPVEPAFVNSMPASTDLAVPPIRRLGEESGALAGHRNGEVFSVALTNGGQEFAVALDDGLAGITALQADLLLTNPEAVEAIGQRGPTKLEQSEYVRLAKSDQDLRRAAAGLPQVTPRFASAETGAVCVVIRDDSGLSEVRVGVPSLEISEAVKTPGQSAEGAVYADYVRVTPGRGAIVQAVPAPGAQAGAYVLVTDLGKQFPVSKAETLGMLGYGGAEPVRLPANLVSLIPAGRALDPDAARAPAGRN